MLDFSAALESAGVVCLGMHGKAIYSEFQVHNSFLAPSRFSYTHRANTKSQRCYFVIIFIGRLATPPLQQVCKPVCDDRTAYGYFYHCG